MIFSSSSATSAVLPALSVALGLPLCRGNNNLSSDIKEGARDGSHDASSPSSCDAPSNNCSPRDDLARRAKSNASRIYARRVINRARLERQHPWASAAAADVVDGSPGDIIRGAPRCDDGHQPPNNPSGSNVIESKWEEWKVDLLSEVLSSLIRLQESTSRVKSMMNTMEQRAGVDYLPSFSNKDVLNRLGIDITRQGPLLSHHNVALCEALTSKQRTLNEYNSLSANSDDEQKAKPAEWSDDIDLVQRRLDFGKEISPLSNTTRLERWSMAVKRMATLGILAAPLGVLLPVNVVLGTLAGSPGEGSESRGEKERTTADAADADEEDQTTVLQRQHQRLTQATWDYALWAIETAGPTYIKLVQWASTRNDLFSPEFVGHFSKLQDETRGHAWKQTEAALERAYGKEWKALLSFDRVIDDEDDETDGIDGGRLKRKGGKANRERQKRLQSNCETGPTASSSSLPTIPIGSGCVAQVYKARLRSSHGLHPAGTSVAVKIQHPNILEKVCLDFYIMNKVASMLEYIPYLNLDYLSMKDSVDQFRDIMLPQLDLRVEAHNLQRFRRDFEGESQIAFPEPLVDLTSREVLVERFVEGEPMLNFVLKEDEHHSRKDREELATIGLETVMKMIFLHDFIHADLHPGNMIVDRNKSARGNPLRVHMIDCGLTVELGERDHMNLVKILGSLIKRDGYAAGKLMVDTAKKCQATELDVEMFCRGIEKICIDDEENNFLESVGDYITDICYMACKHKVKLEAAFINAALACEIMEGLASSLYPDMKVQAVALPMVLKAEMMHGLKGLPTPKLGWLK